ncbi:MAG: serine protease [Armatimonadetes bacterium]|nr:serine protease [Armatimonadota bacterium]
MKLTIAALLIALSLCTACLADVPEDGRKIAEANKDAAVTVQLVLESKMSYQGETQKHENKMNATATVIDASGLTVTSLSQIEPPFGSGMEREGGFSMTIDVVDAKIRLSDGTEIAADVVLRDKDLDLAFLKPKKVPETPLAYVDLQNAGTPQMLDQVVTVSRLGQAGSRALAADFARVQAVVTKPRTFYIVSNAIELGCPAFTLDGKPVGIVIMRTSRGEGGGDDDMSGPMGFGDTLYAVLPCATVLKAAQQAKESASPNKPAPAPAPGK